MAVSDDRAPLPATEAPSLGASFLRQVERGSDRLALRDGDTDITYGALARQAIAVARRLRARGVEPGTIVGICAQRSAEYVIALVGTILAGAAYLPIDPELPKRRIEFMLEDANPRVVITVRSARKLLHLPEERVLSLEIGHVGDPHSTGPFVPLGTLDANACVMYTSGSTGKPKGVCIPQRAVVKLVSGVDYVRLGEGKRLLVQSPLAFDASIFEIWGGLLTGAACILMGGPRPSLRSFADTLLAEKITTAFVTPALLRELVAFAPSAFECVDEVLTGGEVVHADLVRRLMEHNPRTHVIVVYGPTECTTFSTTHRYRDLSTVPDVIPLGEPVAEARIYVLDERMNEVAVGETGEIYIGGARVALGYLNRPELTERSFVRDPFEPDPNATMYRTGDLCLRGAGRELFFKGRRDRQVKFNGLRIELEEIEELLRQHPAVNAAAVKVAAAGPGDQPVLLAYVVPSGLTDTDEPPERGSPSDELTAQWKGVYSDVLYRGLASADGAARDPTLNTTGWKSSFDGRQISDEEMREQVDQAVARVLALSPKRVLEIGCGTGMLLFRLAPRCQQYVGTDFSQEALEYVRGTLEALGTGHNVTLLHRNAHELPEPPLDKFDVVIINSVTEHLPSLDYLDDLLRKLPGIVRPGGYVFVGDNRNFSLLEHFHAAVQLFNSDGMASVNAFAALTELALSEERQLTIDPYYFAQLNDKLFRCVSLQCKRGKHSNELTRYRYDVILQCAPPPLDAPRPLELWWKHASDSLESVRDLLRRGTIDRLALREVPNQRLRGASLLTEAVNGSSAFETTGDLKRAIELAAIGEDPEDYWHLGAELGYDVEVIPSRSPTHFDVAFTRSELAGDWPAFLSEGQPRSMSALANDPLNATRARRLAERLRAYLIERLPQNTVPAFVTPLRRFPLSGNGKIDYAAFPLPARLRQAAFYDPSAQSVSNLGEQLRTAWERVLHISNIRYDENFFVLGGDSLKAVKLAAELCDRLQRDVSPALVFEAPTIAGMEQHLLQSGPTPAANGSGPSTGQRRRRALISRRSGPPSRPS